VKQFPYQNRECRNCVYPCTGGEVLHRRGHCCHSYCPCLMFEPVKGPVLTSSLEGRLKSKRKVAGMSDGSWIK